MAKKRITEDQHLAELNRELRKDEEFMRGMEFLPSPPGSSGREMSGYTVTGRFQNFQWLGIYARVAHKVAEQFELGA